MNAAITLRTRSSRVIANKGGKELIMMVLITFRVLTLSYLPAICSEDWSRRLVPLHSFLSYLWRAVGSEPHSSLREDVPGGIDIPIDRYVALRTGEGAPPIRVRPRHTYRAVHTCSSCCHIGDRYSFPSGLALDLSLQFVEAP